MDAKSRLAIFHDDEPLFILFWIQRSHSDRSRGYK
jgi:hypothetical protein